MATLTLRQTLPPTGTNKGAPLTNAEVDTNFVNLDTAKLEKSGGTLTGTLILAAGTTTIAPIKLTQGVNLTTPQEGAIEFDGTNLYFTPEATRKTVAFQGDALSFESLNVGSATGATTGQIRASGDIIAFSSSDERLKTDVAVIEDALTKVLSLKGVTYTWNAEANELGLEGVDTGVIAQEVEQVLPEVVVTRDDGFKAVKYEKMIGLLIEAIKDLNNKLEKCNCCQKQ